MHWRLVVWKAAALALLVAGLWTTAVSAQGPGGREAQIARVYFEDRAQLNALAAQLDVWEVHRDEGFFVARLTPETMRRLRAQGVRIETEPPLSQRVYLSLLFAPQQRSGIPGYPCYRTVEETYRDLAAMAAAHPQLVLWRDVGDSWEKATPGGGEGYDIHALLLTNRNVPGPKPKFFMIAAIHAREYATAELATRFAAWLIDGYGVNPDITWLLDHYEFHLIPHANPDGRKRAEAGELWRKNTDNDDGCTYDKPEWGYYYGVDLNRNSSFKWNRGGASNDSCTEIYHGPGPASEPEVQAIENYARSIFPDQRGPNDDDPAPPDAEGVFITLHSYGGLVLFPWTWTDAQDAPNKADLATLGRKFGFFNGYEVCSDCLYNASGTTDDFMYGELGVASYTFELGDAFFQDCRAFETEILPKNMPALLYAFKAARRPYQIAKGPDVLNVALSAASVDAGEVVTLTATLDDGRYFSGGHGQEPVQTIQAARYAIDAPVWAGGVVLPMQAADGAFDAQVEDGIATIDTSSLSAGRHIILVEGQDAEGHWGAPTAIFLEVNRPAAIRGVMRALAAADRALGW